MGQAWTGARQHVDRWIEHPREDAHRRSAAGNRTTSIEWVYVLVPLNPQAMTQVEQPLLKRYQVRLESALTIIKDDLEKD